MNSIVNLEFQHFIYNRSISRIQLVYYVFFFFHVNKAEDMVESTHLKNEPWDRTLKEQGQFKLIDYMRAIDSDIVSLPYEEAMERHQERVEMARIFGEN